MPPFGHRKNSAPPEAPPVKPTAPPEPSAEQRLADLLAERTEIEGRLAKHQAQREQWLAGDDDAIDKIIDLADEDRRLRLRTQQIDLQLPNLQAEIAAVQRAARAAHWETLCPELIDAMYAVRDAIRAYQQAAKHYEQLHFTAVQSGYYAEVRETVITPPAAQHNPWTFETFARAVEQRGHQVAPALSMLVEPDIAASISTERKFTPRRVPYQLVEEISPIAPMRRVKLLHTVRADNLNIGHPRLREGEEMMFPARAAFALTYAGVGVYTDAETTEAATAA